MSKATDFSPYGTKLVYNPPTPPAPHVCELPNRGPGYKIGQVRRCEKCGKFWSSIPGNWRTGPGFAWTEGCYHPKTCQEKYEDGMTGYIECTLCGDTI